MKLDAIIDALAELNADQRAQIVARCKLLGAAESKSPGVDAPEELMWAGYVRELERRHMSVPMLGIIRKARGWSRFKDSTKALDEWISAYFSPEDQTERRRAFRIAADCVVRMIDEWDTPLIPSTLLRHAESASQAIEMQFPGYASAGLLRRYVLLS
tara:strand:+ start:2691 stop:3161 length:471 start_codon:yes stop_codon:yes gene_type:complete